MATMRKEFKSRLEAIEWIAEYAKDEGQFEVLREQLMFNFIYHNTYFLDIPEREGEVLMLDPKEQPRFLS